MPPKGDAHIPMVDDPFIVAIVGAGAAGLFTGMIFDYLNREAGSDSFHVKYEILESASTAGGRLSTYNFETGLNGTDNGGHLYYDVGAMRFPENKVMERYALP
jgi:protoporphyrinogen oxidase